MALQFSLFLAGRMPLNDVVSIPLIFGWPGAMQAGLTRMDPYNNYPELQKEYKGVKVLPFFYNGPIQIQSAKKPIHRMEGLKGLIQAEKGPYAIKSMKALGGTPETLNPSFGIIVYTMSGMNKDISLFTIFCGMIPFIAAIIILVVLVILFPQFRFFYPAQ